MSLLIEGTTAEVVVYEIQEDTGHEYYTKGVRILQYSRESGWTIAFEEAHPRTPLFHDVSVQKLKAANGDEALLVVYLASGAGTATFWHVLASIDGEIQTLDPGVERTKVLDSREYADNGYNGVRVEGDRIVERIPGYTRHQARCCPNRPWLEMTFRFTGDAVVFDSVKELPYGPRQLSANGPTLRLQEQGLMAFGFQLVDGFLVLEFSEGRKDLDPSASQEIVDMRKSLLEQNVLIDNGDHLILIENHKFPSSAFAADVLQGRPADGQAEWKDLNGTPASALPPSTLRWPPLP